MNYLHETKLKFNLCMTNMSMAWPNSTTSTEEVAV